MRHAARTCHTSKYIYDSSHCTTRARAVTRAEQNQYRMQYRRFTTPDTTPELPYRLLNFAPDLPKTAPSETAPRVLEGPTSVPSQLDAPRFSAPLAHSSLPLLCAWQVLASLGWCALPGQLAPHT